MARRTDYENYIVLELNRYDLLLRDRKELALSDIQTVHIRWTRDDMNHSDRVVFIDEDGETKVLKNRPNVSNRPELRVKRPDSFQLFEVKTPWFKGMY